MRTKQMKSVLILAMLVIILMSLFSPSFVFAGKVEEKAKESSDGVFDNFDVKVDGNKVTTGSKDTDGTKGWEGIIIKYKNFIVGVAGVAAVTMVVLFIFQFIKLGQSAGNPQARAQALTGVLWTGVAAAGLGAVALITSLFYHSIK